MNDFDANLIREFRTRPAFYDRNNPRFKDKVFTAREWQEISNKLGYDVSLLKDRMLQLRNRYNLEKRRIEQLRDENPGAPVESPWPLFDHLHFLSEHIRARRSYKRMLSAVPQHATRMDLPSGGSNSSSGGGADDADADENGLPQLSLHAAAAAAAAFPNGFLPVRVKMEHIDDTEPNSNGSETTGMNGHMPSMHMQAFHQQQQQHEQQQQQHQQQQQRNQQNDTDADESESQSVTDNGAFLAAQSAVMLSNKQYAFAQHQQQQQQLQQRLHPSAPPPLKIRRIDSMRAGVANTWVPVPQQNNHHQHHQQQQQKRHSHSNNSNFNSSHSLRSASTKLKSSSILPAYATPREQKYAAFGDFVASSLLDLPSVTAMQLIEKFTTEVVKVLIENDEATENEKNSSTAATVAACNGVVTGVGPAN